MTLISTPPMGSPSPLTLMDDNTVAFAKFLFFKPPPLEKKILVSCNAGGLFDSVTCECLYLPSVYVVVYICVCVCVSVSCMLL